MNRAIWVVIFLVICIPFSAQLSAQESEADTTEAEPYSILDELNQYEQEASFEEFQLIDYFGVIDASISISGEIDSSAPVDSVTVSDTTTYDSTVGGQKLTRENLIIYAKERFSEAFTGIEFESVPKSRVVEMLRKRFPDRHEVGLILIDVKISAYKKIAALNVTMQAGNLRTVEIWKKTEGEYYLREETDAFSRVKKVVDDLMVQLAIDFYKSRLGIY